MLRKLAAIALIGSVALPLPCVAADFGWHVYSFSWASFTGALPDMEEDIAGRLGGKDAPTETEAALLFENYIVDTFFNVPAPFGAVLESPAEGEFYAPGVLHDAYKQLVQKNKQTLLRYFDTGKSIARYPQSLRCLRRAAPDWGYCEAVVFFDPDEVKALAKEVTSLSPSLDATDASRRYLLHLDGVLRKAVAEQRALMFSSRD